MLYRRFPGCRKRRSAHTTSHGRCQVRQEWLATPVSSKIGQLGRYRDGRVLLVSGGDKGTTSTKAKVRRRNQPATVDEMKRLNISLVLHGPTVVHLHPTRIPDNSGAAARRIRSGLAFTVSSERGGHASWLIQAMFPKPSLGVICS